MKRAGASSTRGKQTEAGLMPWEILTLYSAVKKFIMQFWANCLTLIVLEVILRFACI